MRVQHGILSVDFIQPLQAGALGNTVKESQIKIIELQHLVEALRYIYRFDHIDLICGGVMKVRLPFKHAHSTPVNSCAESNYFSLEIILLWRTPCWSFIQCQSSLWYLILSLLEIEPNIIN